MNVMKKAILAKAKVGAKNPELRAKALKRLVELRIEVDEASRRARQDLKLEEAPTKHAPANGACRRWWFWARNL